MSDISYQPQPILGDAADLFDKTRHTVPKYARPEASITASKDLKLVVAFLARYKSNPRTVAAYRSELERLLHWSWHVREQSLLDHNDKDLVDYLEFSKAPPVHWIGTSPMKRFIELKPGKFSPNPNWRPYVAKLRKKELTDRHAVLQANASGQQASVKRPGPEVSDHNPSPATLIASLRVLSALYKYLVVSKNVAIDYVKLMPQTKSITGVDQTANQVMRLTSYQWEYVIEFATELADEKNSRQHERTLFVMSILFSMYLRISELVWDDISKPVMSDFIQDSDGNWWLRVLGKGNKQRNIPVADSMLEALSRYRLSRELPAYPDRNEHDIPLVAVIRNDSILFQHMEYYRETKKRKEWFKYAPVTSTRTIRQLVQKSFDHAYKQMLSKKHIQAHEAESLKAATVHWLRHTGISEDVKDRDAQHVQLDAGHATMATTNRYIDIEDRARHSTAKKKEIKDRG